jgi:UDP-N-acetylglucosamine 2-epimerase (non-hydrolysing)
MTLKTLCVFGTRPEAIKMAPVIHKLQAHPEINNEVCVTGQHEEMLKPLLDLFAIEPQFNLKVMTSNQSLSDLTSRILLGMTEILKNCRPNLVLIHGDTTTTLATALAAYYQHIPVAHVEAGLRTGDIYKPWPEEANRKLSGVISSLHFAPTQSSRENLLQEAVDPSKIFITGNTVIDALFQIASKLEANPDLTSVMQCQFPMIKNDRKFILVTGHRRENFGQGFESICQALITIVKKFPEIDIIYPVHLNPNVQKPIKSLLKDINNIHLIEPVDYLPFVYLMKSSYLILTDSGGIQEEAPSLGKPVLVMRDLTERPEAVKAGTVTLVGTEVNKIVECISELLINKDKYHRMSRAQNPYGDGEAAQRIVNIIVDTFITRQKLDMATG